MPGQIFVSELAAESEMLRNVKCTFRRSPVADTRFYSKVPRIGLSPAEHLVTAGARFQLIRIMESATLPAGTGFVRKDGLMSRHVPSARMM